MTDKLFGFSSARRRSSLYLGLVANIFIGLAVAVACYFFVSIGGNYFISQQYATPQMRQERREKYIAELQYFATVNSLSSEDTDKIAAWAREHPYVYLLIYKNDELFFSSDMSEDTDKDNESGNEVADGEEGEDNSESSTGGIETPPTGNRVNREELIAEAEANGLNPIELTDGPILAAVTEFTEDLYYEIANVVSFSLAALVLTVVLINYFRKIIARIKRLESDVTIVSHVNMNHKIVTEGKDEISRLSDNVEIMRNAMLENIEKEREAREANTELVTSISHDIRTPLTVLLGYLDMMKSREVGDEVMRGYIVASEKTAMRLKELSDDMFKYSLAFGDASGGIKLEDYDAQTLLEQMLSEHILLLSEGGYNVVTSSLDFKLDEGATVQTDAPNLMRIIDNIFSNVQKYADKAAPIILSVKRERNSLTLYCKNKIRTDGIEAESNGIGLKTCARLAVFIADGFGYRSEGGYFTVYLSLKINNPRQRISKER